MGGPDSAAIALSRRPGANVQEHGPGCLIGKTRLSSGPGPMWACLARRPWGRGSPCSGSCLVTSSRPPEARQLEIWRAVLVDREVAGEHPDHEGGESEHRENPSLISERRSWSRGAQLANANPVTAIARSRPIETHGRHPHCLFRSPKRKPCGSVDGSVDHNDPDSSLADPAAVADTWALPDEGTPRLTPWPGVLLCGEGCGNGLAQKRDQRPGAEPPLWTSPRSC